MFDAMQSNSPVGKRELNTEYLDSIMTALFSMSDLGIMVTDLEHVTLAVNARFGEIFHVDPTRVPTMEVEELRECVYPRLKDPDLWRVQLDEIYADPESTYEDALELVDDLITLLRRSTFPLRNAKQEVLGRIWTFEDITEEHLRSKRRDAMQQVSSFHDPDPGRVCRFVVDRVAQVFGSTCLLSIWSGEKLLFRESANVPEWLSEVRENTLTDSYCQVALKTVKPLSVQNALNDDRFCGIVPAKIGLTRYAGVPICNPSGSAIGTLCILDSNSQVPIFPEDLEFLNVMANRISTELERERVYEERMADQRRLLDQQERELVVTREVFVAMNSGFELLSKDLCPEEILTSEAKLLCGLLGYHSAAVVRLEGQKLAGVIATSDGSVAPLHYRVAKGGPIASAVDSKAGDLLHVKDPRPGLRDLLSADYMTISKLPTDLRETYLIILGRHEAPPVGDQHHDTHLLALIDQVALLLTIGRLNEDLRAAHKDLKDAQDRMIQGEKLSVVGALSASVAHDIRNILASISIECSLASQDPVVTLENVRRQTERFSVLSHRLLSYARPKYISREEIDLNEIVGRAIDMLETQIRVTGVELVSELDSKLPRVPGDPHRVEHLMVNLMLNALQAMGTHNGQLNVATQLTESRAVITVRDNGRGMSQDTARRVFQPFYSTRKDGFGLGLYSCLKIAEEHGWELSVDSQVGKGSSFKIQIPLERKS